MPRLNLVSLQNADAETAGKHQHGMKFRLAYRGAEDYNANYKDDGRYSEAEAWLQVQRLDKVMELAGEWLTAKPIKQEGGAVSRAKAEKNAARWQALAQLCGECSAGLIALGFRPLSGHWAENPLAPPDAAHPNYWLERLDPKHRSATALKGEYATWSALPSDDPN
jgi:hypothetical protein